MPVEALVRCGVFRTVMHSCGTCLHQSVHFLLMVQTAGVFILCKGKLGIMFCGPLERANMVAGTEASCLFSMGHSW